MFLRSFYPLDVGSDLAMDSISLTSRYSVAPGENGVQVQMSYEDFSYAAVEVSGPIWTPRYCVDKMSDCQEYPEIGNEYRTTKLTKHRILI